MKTAFTHKKWGIMLAFLCTMMFSYQSWSQKVQAKCPGFTAKISNGSVLNLCTGASVNLTATPVVSGYSYQWQRQANTGGAFANIAGANSSNYMANASGAYRIIVSTGSCIDTSGITSVISLVVTGGTITPVNTLPLCFGESGGKITGSQVPGADLGFVTYAWEMNESNAGWVAISGASDVDYLVPLLFKSTAYRRIAKDNCGNQAYSNVVNINLVADLLPGTLTPASQTITRAQTAAPITSATPASGGSGAFTYQWQAAFWERGPYKNIIGATSADYAPGHLDETFYFRRVVTDTRCRNSVNSGLSVVFVTDGILNAGNLAIPYQCFFPGNPASIILTFNAPRGGVPPYSIQWESSLDNVTFSPIAGATGISLQPGILSETTWFRKKVTDAAGTVAYTPSEVITKISTPLTGGSIKALANVACLGSSPAQIKSTGSPAGFVGLSYQWQYKNNTTGNQWVDIVGQIREAIYPEPITEKTTYRRVAVDKCGSAFRYAYSNEIEIDIRPAIDAGDISPTSQMVRAGQTPLPIVNTDAPSGGTGSFTISWETATNIAMGPWTLIPSVTTLGYQPPVETQTTYFRRATMDNGCLATKYTYGVEVFYNAFPPITGGDLAGSNCQFKNSAPSLITTGPNPPMYGTPPFTYQWETRPGTSGAWTILPGETNESYQPPILIQTTQFRRLITDIWGESAYSEPFTINYVSAPLIPGTIATTSIAVCSGIVPGLIIETAPATGGGTITYQWQMKTVGGTYTNIPGATGTTYQPGAITQKTYYRRIASETCGSITRSANSNEVSIDISVVTNFLAGLVDGPFITCSGTAPGVIKSVLNACAGNTNISYQWEILQGGTWQSIPGATMASYTPGAITTFSSYRRRAYNDCGNSGYSNQVDIYVYPPIEAGTIGTTTQSVCANALPSAIKLLANCHYTDGTVTYQWQRSTTAGGTWTNIIGATTNVYQPGPVTANAYYRLRVNSSRCASTVYTNVASVLIDVTCRTSNSNTLSETMKVYPNPLTGNTMEVRVNTKGTTSVTLMNGEGRSFPISVSNTGSGKLKITSSANLNKGMYLLTVRDENNSYTEKVIVQ